MTLLKNYVEAHTKAVDQLIRGAVRRQLKTRPELLDEAVQESWEDILRASRREPAQVDTPCAYVVGITKNAVRRVARSQRKQWSRYASTDVDDFGTTSPMLGVGYEFERLLRLMNDKQLQFMELAMAKCNVFQIAVAMRCSRATAYRIRDELRLLIESLLGDDDPPPAGSGKRRRKVKPLPMTEPPKLPSGIGLRDKTSSGANSSGHNGLARLLDLPCFLDLASSEEPQPRTAPTLRELSRLRVFSDCSNPPDDWVTPLVLVLNLVAMTRLSDSSKLVNAGSLTRRLGVEEKGPELHASSRQRSLLAVPLPLPRAWERRALLRQILGGKCSARTHYGSKSRSPDIPRTN